METITNTSSPAFIPRMKLLLILTCSSLVPAALLQKINGSELISIETEELNNFEPLIMDILGNALQPYKCVAIIYDEVYYHVFENDLFQRFGIYITFILIFIDDSEDLLSPYEETQISLTMAKTEGCQFYIICVSNTIQVIRLLRFGDRYRILNTRANFIMLYDHRLFEKDLHYLWKRIVNVIFIREYGGGKSAGVGNTKKVAPWFEISTVPFPSPIKGILVPRRLDIWKQSKFRSGTDLFKDKTSDLKNQTLKVVTFSHIPATTKVDIPKYKTVRTVIMGSGNIEYSGIEIEILQTLSVAMNFMPDLYEPENADMELWGEKQSDGQFTGMTREMVKSLADVALGDLYYTPQFLDLMDLSIPYNSECLTFLTPESLTSNSWKTLILPFKPIMWLLLVISLIVIGLIFFALSRFHAKLNRTAWKQLELEKQQQLEMRKPLEVHTLRLNSNTKYYLMKQQYEQPKMEGEPEGMYQFDNIANSLLYTYGMLLVISLPKLPTGWSIRMLTGWYWLYCTLVVVAYKASMTAILANPAPRVTIDTLEELVESKLACGGLREINRDFFKTALDAGSQAIGERFVTVNDSGTAIDKIARGAFAFYENVYFLKEASVKKQLQYQMLQSNATHSDEAFDHNLHIMSDCLINMPISIGLQKNSPIKPRVNKFIRQVFEAGLIKKWLDDVMQPTVNAEIHLGNLDGGQALMNLRKFYGGIVALFIGYFISVVGFVSELVYFQFVTKKNPHFNKYSKQVEK